MEPNDDLTKLYRPVGRKELELIRAGGWREFPPRLPWQPIFYPVLEQEYAEQIARDWNTNDEASGFSGYVMEFQVRTEFLARYSVQIAGAARHSEYWIPAEDLPAFNSNIVGPIRVIAEFHSDSDSQKM